MSRAARAVFADGSQIEKRCCGWVNPKRAICQRSCPGCRALCTR